MSLVFLSNCSYEKVYHMQKYENHAKVYEKYENHMQSTTCKSMNMFKEFLCSFIIYMQHAYHIMHILGQY